jgi:hypothetical protein
MAIYVMSFTKAMGRLQAVLDELNRARAGRDYEGPASKWHVPVLEATDHLLDAIFEHIDDCGRNILQCLSESRDDPTLRKARSVFNKGASAYKDHVAEIANALKHGHRTLGHIFFWALNDFDPGYFVEGPAEDGSIGPDPKIHREGRDAFSFSRDLRFHVCGLYFVGAALGPALALFGKLSKAAGPSAAKDPDTTFETLRQVSLLPLRFFPNERQAIPIVKGFGTFDRPRILLEYPSKARIIGVSGQMRVGLAGDGFSDKFRFPTFFE